MSYNIINFKDKTEPTFFKYIKNNLKVKLDNDFDLFITSFLDLFKVNDFKIILDYFLTQLKNNDACLIMSTEKIYNELLNRNTKQELINTKLLIFYS